MRKREEKEKEEEDRKKRVEEGTRRRRGKREGKKVRETKRSGCLRKDRQTTDELDEMDTWPHGHLDALIPDLIPLRATLLCQRTSAATSTESRRLLEPAESEPLQALWCVQHPAGG